MSWQRSSLGRSLVDKLVQHLVTANNLQMWVAFICVLGGTKRVSTMLSPSMFQVVVPGGAKESASLKLMEAALDCKLDAYWGIWLLKSPKHVLLFCFSGETPSKR